MALRPADFKSDASTGFATQACAGSLSDTPATFPWERSWARRGWADGAASGEVRSRPGPLPPAKKGGRGRSAPMDEALSCRIRSHKKSPAGAGL